MAQPDLFGGPDLPKGVHVLRGFARDAAGAVLAAAEAVTGEAPFRTMQVPGGGTMSVAMSNCGRAGWVTDASGYRYSESDPLSGKPWPAMPEVIAGLARAAAETAGFPGFAPDACLINRYEPGARMGLHQDRDEQDRKQPIVSVSYGLPATFLFGGGRRSDPRIGLVLEHGDVVVWGGPARLYYHGIAPLKDGVHPMLGRQRINLTLRKAL
ncbi:DNA oxidative demethylase AlkB [Asticcacaulis solisilvae]|uniref:DNA oxidative demethylase AlkB n=1 Tax=Asticcacaulis solisilvae TaxID=1217274 RepID=UPI003FD6FE54